MDIQQFIDQIVTIARNSGLRIQTNRSGLTQIDFGNKKLHARHLRSMYPQIMLDGEMKNQSMWPQVYEVCDCAT